MKTNISSIVRKWALALLIAGSLAPALSLPARAATHANTPVNAPITCGVESHGSGK